MKAGIIVWLGILTLWVGFMSYCLFPLYLMYRMVMEAPPPAFVPFP
uniref:Uncharacterized protein n=1 Tax=viral metagenome TaxID=1070528 RepID=A0A6H2A3I5_9ZZZZ